MYQEPVLNKTGFLVAALISISGCASVPYCQDNTCQSGQCTVCQTEEQTDCCNSDSGSSCNQDCQPKWKFTGYQYDQCFDNLGQSKNARCCANRALKHIDSQTESSISCDFKSGFRKAYQDIAMGRKGTTPAIPPEKYWYAYYRSSKGRVHAKEWFSGYEKGVEMAKMSGLYDSRQILSSLMKQSEY